MGLDYGDQTMSINLLPWREQQNRLNTRRFLLALCFALGLIVIIACCFRFWIKLSMSPIVKENSLLKESIATIQYSEADFKKIISQRRQRLQIIAFIQKKMRGHYALLNVLQQIGEAMPNRLRLTEFKKEDNEISLFGKAKEPGTISQFIKALNNKDQLADVAMDNVQYQSQQMTGEHVDNSPSSAEFSMSARINMSPCL